MVCEQISIRLTRQWPWLLVRKMGKKMQKADKLGASHALILGSSEVAENKVTVKDLKAGTQNLVPRSELFNLLGGH